MDIWMWTVLLLLGIPGAAYVAAWAVQSEAGDDSERAARLVMQFNRHAKKRREAHMLIDEKINAERRIVRAIIYQQGPLRQLWHRVVGPGPAVREHLARIRELNHQLLEERAELDHYNVLIRGELHRAARQYPGLADTLKKMLS